MHARTDWHCSISSSRSAMDLRYLQPHFFQARHRSLLSQSGSLNRNRKPLLPISVGNVSSGGRLIEDHGALATRPIGRPELGRGRSSAPSQCLRCAAFSISRASPTFLSALPSAIFAAPLACCLALPIPSPIF